MKRDMDLARKILLQVEECVECDGSTGWLKVDVNGHSQSETLYHVRLLYGAGLIDVHDESSLAGQALWPKRLTWEGHEFLDAAREDTRWQKAKRLVFEKTGGLSFDVLKAVLAKLTVEAASGFLG